MAKRTQETIFEPRDTVANPPVAAAADKFVESLEAEKQSKEELEKAQAFLINEMNKTMQYRIFHRGRELEIVNTDPKQKIKVKEIKPKGKGK